MKAVSREKRAAETRVSELEADFKSVLAKHAREVESATSARREASRAAAARQAAEAELQRSAMLVRVPSGRLSRDCVPRGGCCSFPHYDIAHALHSSEHRGACICFDRRFFPQKYFFFVHSLQVPCPNRIR